MIGARAGVLGAATIGAVIVVFGGRSADANRADPPRAVAREALLEDRIRAADAALAGMQAQLEAALDAARRGSALVVAGDEAPSPHLSVAAQRLEDARGDAAAAVETLIALDGTLQGLESHGQAPQPPVSAEELASIAAQLRATESTADEFAAMRGRSEDTLADLQRALAALDGGHPDRALEPLSRAREVLEMLRAWNVELVTLPIWIDGVDRMIAALDALARAVAADDSAGAEAALASFQDAASEAREADVALRLAMSEGGSAVTAPPLHRLVEALRGTIAARTELALLQPAPPPAM